MSSSAFDGIERLTHNHNGCIHASRPHIGEVRERYEDAIRAKQLEYGDVEIPPEDMAAIRRAIRLQLEEEKTGRVRGAIICLVVAAIFGAVIFMMTFG